MRTRFERWVLLVGLLTVVFYLPSVMAAPCDDELHSLYQAALTLKHPSRILLPWMGGVFRILPKLVIMGGLSLWGLRISMYHLLNIALHVFSTVLVARLARNWSGSDRVGIWTAALFAFGLGHAGKAVVVISNVTMLLGLALMLASLSLLWSGRWKSALVLFLLAAASHEVVIVAPLLILPLACVAEDRRLLPSTPLIRRLVGMRRVPMAVSFILLALIPLSFFPGLIGRLCSFEVRMISFVFLPLTTGGAAIMPGHVGDVVAKVVPFIIARQFWIGAVILLPLSYLVWRGRALYALGAGWVMLFCLPSWAIAQHWEGPWLELRYTYIPAIGICLIVSSLAARIAERHRLVSAMLLSLLVLWSVTLSGLWLRRYIRISRSPYEVALRAEFYNEMADVDSRWVLP